LGFPENAVVLGIENMQSFQEDRERTTVGISLIFQGVKAAWAAEWLQGFGFNAIFSCFLLPKLHI